MGELLNLKPELLWKHFEEICKRPHPSRKEKLLADYVISVAKKNNLKYKVDKFGNVVVSKPATPGFENVTPVVLQGHLDMVAEKNADVKHDFDKDPIQPYVDGDWVKAKGTTLGSDNGIGVAAALAVLEDNSIQHGPIEALFTLDEETGLNGAQALEPGFINGEIMMNLDSEEDGALYIGCAGGQNSTVKFNFKLNDIPANTVAVELKVTGLKGGHSGLDIHLGKGNAIKLMVRLLHELNYNYGIRLVNINGGSKHNAIPRECFATIRVPKKSFDDVKGYVEHYNEIVRAELSTVEPTLIVSAENSKSKSKVMDKTTANNLIDSLYAVPNGVIKMSADIEGLVETSTNLAVVTTKAKYVEVVLSHRSSVESEKKDLGNSIAALFKLAKAEVTQGDGYPGWKPNINSPILGVMKKVFHEKLGKEPEVKAIHAGLECGIILERFPHLDIISFGPTIFGAHSPDEKVQISTVQTFWNNLTEALRNVPVKQ
ncbi:aminoacyl-histidine dipeptidase [Stygiobacter electus]|uniref:Cytosol non-specific dipeptidase n=1 Tax=Stygiobacter electus TaxID=3032292 RepID=A0AAE3TDL5_9BACT|nr:aminoacyl-histidine dipeptidase [Stygiobacter electus]MDF1611522.1 aminoacyl-histidine dipeptidase [Stygiobacter electus]